MTLASQLSCAFAGTDARLRRQVVYWAITVGLYAVCVLLLAFQVRVGVADPDVVSMLVTILVAGTLLFYVPVRMSRRLALSPSLLAMAQAVFAIGCIVAAYAAIGPARASTLAILVVVLVFCAFALTPRQSHAMSALAVALLGATMVAMNRLQPDRYPASQELVNFVIAASMLAAVTFLTGRLSLLRDKLKAQHAELAQALARIQEMATRDDLTLLTNRRHMNELLAYEKERHDRKGRALSIALLDIDWFKRVNDAHGHAAGDNVLRDFAQQALGAVRATDVLARWGGEEFLLMLPDTEPQAAAMVLERMRARIAAHAFSTGESPLRISFSGGLTSARKGETIAAMIARSDAALYAAKAGGRDRIVSA
ncbi:MAG TPA: diguanylate cyclase [Burkholderiaceae bacterium]|nr:diguanylate cyclase [Burkholderiaceae bacterium]